ncbi:MAG: AAA family ATPase [Enterovibrio sp.]
MSDFSQLRLMSSGELIDNADVIAPNFILHGLEEAHIGMLIAAPEMGKSHLALSIAIEHATRYTLVGLSAPSSPSKVLIISAEDSISIIKEQLKAKYECLTKKYRDLARANVYPFSAQLPLVCSPDATSSDKATTEAYIARLVSLIRENGINLVIIDTVSEVIGTCDEVRHDRLIKMAFQRIAKESGAALLLIHHVNKAEIRGDNQVTMASGAGLTTVMRLSKLIIGLEQKNESKQVNFLKANYLRQEEKKSFNVEFSSELLVRVGVNPISQKKAKVISELDEPPTRPAPLIVKHVSAPPSKEKIKKSIREAF